MSDETAVADEDLLDEAVEDGDEDSKGKRKKMLLIAAPVVLLLVVGVGGYFFGIFDRLLGSAPTEEEAAIQSAYFYELPEVTVNLATTGSRAQYLKVRISLELQDRAIVRAITPVQPRIMDVFQVYLRELRPADLEGSMGVYRLKEELLKRVNLAVHPHRVERVLFNEMLIQ
ncbi:MAG: flagellar basal body-associated FliL family protein [Pseudomonadota bacterium]